MNTRTRLPGDARAPSGPTVTEPPVLALVRPRRVRVKLTELVPVAGLAFPAVKKLPKPSPEANQLLSLLLSAQTAIVTTPDSCGIRQVIANQGTVALALSFVPRHRHPSFEIECWEWPANHPAVSLACAPQALLDLMVERPTPLPTRELLRHIRTEYRVELRRHRPNALDALVSSSRRPRK